MAEQHTSSTAKKILVIGAGIGGLSAATLLANQGHQVTVIEKNAQAGGKLLRIKKNGFTFDGGASFITLKEVYQEFFTACGVRLDDYIHIEKMDTTTTFHFAKGKSFSLFNTQEKVRAEITKKFPGEEAAFDRFMKIGKDLYEVLYQGPKYAARNYHRLGGFEYLLHPRVLLDAPKLQLLKTWKQIVDSLFVAPELRAVFSYQATFMGMKPSEALGTYAFLPWLEINDGMYHIKGGVYGIVEGFLKLAKEKDVKFLFNCEAQAVIHEQNRVTGVKTNKGLKTADIVVSNTDGAYFYTHLMPANKNRSFTPEKIKAMKHTNSYFTINLGLKKPLPKFTHHTFFVADHWQDFFENMFTPGAVRNFSSENLCYYLSEPSLSDPYLAPKGNATAFILVPVPGYDPEFNWQKEETKFKNMIFDVMEKRDGVPIRQLIEEEVVYSPARWGREFNLWENIILSFAPTFFQVNNFRMPNKSKEFENLYFVGSSTIPGPGVPTCITSGHLVTERIMEDLG